jgi:hypothetical protein
MDFSPAVSLRANVTAVRLNGRAVPYRIETTDADQHVSVHFDVPRGKSTLRLRVNDDVEVSFVSRLPAPGGASQGLRILSESWTPERDRLDLDVAGVAGNTYEISLVNASQATSLEGAQLNEKTNKSNNANPRAAKLLVRFPSGPDAYPQHRITVHFAPQHPASSALGQ